MILGLAPCLSLLAQQSDNPVAGYRTQYLRTTTPPSVTGDPTKDTSVYGCLDDLHPRPPTRPPGLRGRGQGRLPHAHLQTPCAGCSRGSIRTASSWSPTASRTCRTTPAARYDGLGLVVSAKDGVLIVVSARWRTPRRPVPGSSAADQILKNQRCDHGEDAAIPTRWPRSRDARAIPSRCRILRPASKEVRDIQLVRTEIKVESVQGTRTLIDPALTGDYKVGYVRIIQFQRADRRRAEQASRRTPETGDGIARARSAQ